jgi:hypothetical protein
MLGGAFVGATDVAACAEGTAVGTGAGAGAADAVATGSGALDDLLELAQAVEPAAVSARSAARASRSRGQERAGALCASPRPQNGQRTSVRRTCRRQDKQGTRFVIGSALGGFTVHDVRFICHRSRRDRAERKFDQRDLRHRHVVDRGVARECRGVARHASRRGEDRAHRSSRADPRAPLVDPGQGAHHARARVAQGRGPGDGLRGAALRAARPRRARARAGPGGHRRGAQHGPLARRRGDARRPRTRRGAGRARRGAGAVRSLPAHPVEARGGAPRARRGRYATRHIAAAIPRGAHGREGMGEELRYRSGPRGVRGCRPGTTTGATRSWRIRSRACSSASAG